MFKLSLLLCGGLFLVMLIGGRDAGQQRMGLTGAYDAHLSTAATEAAVVADPAPAVARPAAMARATTPAARPVLQPTPAAFSPAPETSRPAEPLQPTAPAGLTLALPLAEAQRASDPVAAPAAGNDPRPQVNYVLGSNVNVREGPSAQAAVLDRLARGEAVTVLGGDTPGWSMIRIEGDGIEGFIASRYLSATPPEASLFPPAD